MVMQVNQELCIGCGVCVDACSVGALRLVNYRAEIDAALCTACEACIEACPNGAILAQAIQEPGMSLIALPAAESRPVPAPIQIVPQQTATPARGLAPLAGATLAFLGSEVAPRLVDLFITVLDRKLAQPQTAAISPLSTSPKILASQGRGKKRRARCRGGRVGAGNHTGRR